jgi:hypothetical protein
MAYALAARPEQKTVGHYSGALLRPDKKTGLISRVLTSLAGKETTGFERILSMSEHYSLSVWRDLDDFLNFNGSARQDMKSCGEITQCRTHPHVHLTARTHIEPSERELVRAVLAGQSLYGQ